MERAIRYIRTHFFAARQWESIDDLNAQADQWCAGASADRRWPDDTTTTVGEAFEQEKTLMLNLPDNAFTTGDRVEVRVGKTPYIRFDLNDYSVPHEYVQTTLSVLATQNTVRVIDPNTGQELASHHRCWDKGQHIELDAHLKALTEAKRQASRARGQHRLRAAVPSSEALLKAAAARGYHLRSLVRALLRLLDEYGADELERACTEALEREVPHDNAVRQSLERRREEKQLPVPLALPAPINENAKYLSVRSHPLASYDTLQPANTPPKKETPPQ